MSTPAAWLLLTKSDGERSWAANRGYDDAVDSYYSYDSRVANHKNLKEGDVIVVREDDYVAGWGVVELIVPTPNMVKVVRTCPFCGKANFAAREVKKPKNRCNSCKGEFEDEEAVNVEVAVTQFKCLYGNTWTEAVVPIHAREVESYIATKDYNNAIRPLRAESLENLLVKISARRIDSEVQFSDSLVTEILGGHKKSVVRRRVGQRAFRLRMIDKFGESCAFSGKQPPQVLEAAHLYSYAERPEHKQDGGLLLRRDFHSLFDAKLMTVNPNRWNIEVAPRIRNYRIYGSLHGSPLLVPRESRPDSDLIADHYEVSWREFQNQSF